MQRDLEIFQDIVASIPEKGVSVPEGFNFNDYYSYSHDEPRPTEGPNHRLFLQYKNDADEEYEITEELEIYKDSYVDGEKIVLSCYAHNSPAECDVSTLIFVYEDGTWSEVCCEDDIPFILDFSKYH